MTRSEADSLRGSEIIDARVIYRPWLHDALVWIDIEDLPGPLSPNPVIYGLSLEVDDRPYELRAARSAPSEAAFGLYACDRGPRCTKVADLRGGWGTTGDAVAIRVPLDALGLDVGAACRPYAPSRRSERSISAP